MAIIVDRGVESWIFKILVNVSSKACMISAISQLLAGRTCCKISISALSTCNILACRASMLSRCGSSSSPLALWANISSGSITSHCSGPDVGAGFHEHERVHGCGCLGFRLPFAAWHDNSLCHGLHRRQFVLQLVS